MAITSIPRENQTIENVLILDAIVTANFLTQNNYIEQEGEEDFKIKSRFTNPPDNHGIGDFMLNAIAAVADIIIPSLS